MLRTACCLVLSACTGAFVAVAPLRRAPPRSQQLAAARSGAASELLSLITARYPASLKADDAARADGLVVKLAAEKVAFTPALLGGGLWCATHTAFAPTPRWRAAADALPGFANVQGQEYDLAAGRVTNYGEVAGQALYV